MRAVRDPHLRRTDHDEGQQPRVRHPPRAEALDDPRVGDARHRHHRRGAAEHVGERRARAEMLADELLGGIDVAEHRADHQCGAEHVADRGAAGRRDPHVAREHLGLNLLPELRMQRLGQAHRGPDAHHRAHHAEADEQPAPAGELHHRLADAGRDHGYGDEHRRDQREHPRHRVAFELIADDRAGQHHQPRGGQPLEDAQHDQLVETLRERAAEAEHHVAGERQHQQQLAPEAVGEHAGYQRARAGREQEQPDDVLALVGIDDVEIARDLVERRQHAVDRQRMQRHQPGREHDQLFASETFDRLFLCGCHGLAIAGKPLATPAKRVGSRGGARKEKENGSRRGRRGSRDAEGSCLRRSRTHAQARLELAFGQPPPLCVLCILCALCANHFPHRPHRTKLAI